MSRTVVVTGCSSGFGRQVSEQLARKGDRVYATMRDTAGKNAEITHEVQALAAAEGLDLRVLELDVTSTSSVNSAAAKVLAESGAPAVVINNAGQMYAGITEAFSADEFMNQLDVNLVGVHRVNRAFLPAMREAWRGTHHQYQFARGSRCPAVLRRIPRQQVGTRGVLDRAAGGVGIVWRGCRGREAGAVHHRTFSHDATAHGYGGSGRNLSGGSA
jgi:NAD(P)-dependent dehydrogenase (short-subunit alcohol dehydrogenase family)